MTESPFNLSTLVLDKNAAKVTIFANGRNPKPMREYAPFPKVVGFIQNEMGISLQGNPRYEWMTTVKTELEMMQKYHSLWNRKQLCFTTAHSLAKSKWGRTIPANNSSLNIMHRPTRHALCKDEYEDWDMKNAHVSIICQTFKDRPDIDISALWEYANNPTKWREEICIHHGLDPVKDKDSAKQLFIRILFGGSYLKWIRDFDIEKNISASQRHPLVTSIETQLVGVRDLFYEANPQIVKDLKRHDRENKFADISQLKRSLLGVALQTIERWVMEECVSVLVENRKMDLRDIVPCQDGFMIRKHLSYGGLKQDIEAATFDRFGMRIEWVRKEFDEAIIIPDAVIERTLQEWDCLITDTGLAKRFLGLYGNQIQYKRPLDGQRDFLYIFDSERKRWNLEDSKASITLRNLIGDMHSGLVEEIEADVALTQAEKMTLLSTARRYLLDSHSKNGIAREVIDNAEWSGMEFDSVPYYLGFENGFKDLRTNTFEEYREDIHITITTGYNYIEPDYKDGSEDCIIRDELTEMFNGLFDKTEDTLYLLQVLASCLDAVNYQYLWFFTGAGGNGKGVVLNLIKDALGGRFYKAASCGLLTLDSDKANQTSEDLCALKNARAMVFSEMDKTEGMTWSSCKLFTGRETVSGRQLYKGLESFNLQTSVIGAFNVKPEMIGSVTGAERASIERRLRVLLFPHLYTEDPKKIASNPEVYKLGNKEFQSEAWRKKVRHIFLDLLCGVYAEYYNEKIGELDFTEPESVKVESSKYLQSENLFQEIFEDLYVTDAEKKEDKPFNRIWLKDVFEEIQHHELYKDGMNGRGRKQFSRAWNRKKFTEWMRDAFEVKFSTDRQVDYILGYTKKLDYIDAVEEGN